MPSSGDWSLTPATLARVAVTETLEPTLELTPEAEKTLESHPELSLGIDCCGVCAKPEAAMGDGAVECSNCKSVVYCGSKCKAADRQTHQRTCALLGFAADLADVGRADMEVSKSAAAAAVESTVDNLKLPGDETAQAILGPRGYRRTDDDTEDGTDQASRDAVKLRWGAILKLAKGKEPNGKGSDNKTDVEALSAATLRTHGEYMSYPLSIVTASWMFPIVHYALMIGGGVGQEERYEDGANNAGEQPPGQVHLVAGAASAAANAPQDANWWPWLVEFACKLPKPGVEIVVVGEEVVEGDSKNYSKSDKKGKGTAKGKFKHVKKSVHSKTYSDFVSQRESENAPGPYLIFASDLVREDDAESIITAARRSAAPFVTASKTEMDLAVELELFESNGFELVGVEKNPFAFPVPSQSPQMGNDTERGNDWLACYVPSSGAKGVDTKKRSTDDGKNDAKKSKK